MSAFNTGDVFHHHLRVERFLAAGAHGEVYVVRHLATGEPFALKVMPLADESSEAQVQRALAAARGAYGIDHPNVVKVHDIGCEAGGRVYLLMELLQGCSIATLLGWSRVSVVMALSVAIEAARGLAAAHETGVIHRDVKPANLFLVNGGPGRTAVKVLDFSTAKVFPEGIETSTGRAGLGDRTRRCPSSFDGGSRRELRRVRARPNPVGDARRMAPVPRRAGRPLGPPLQAARRDAAAALGRVRAAPAHRRRRAQGDREAGRGALPHDDRDGEGARRAARLACGGVPGGAPGARRVAGRARDPRRLGEGLFSAVDAEDVAETLPLGGRSLAGLLPVRDALVPPEPPKRKAEPR